MHTQLSVDACAITYLLDAYAYIYMGICIYLRMCIHAAIDACASGASQEMTIGAAGHFVRWGAHRVPIESGAW